MPCPCNLKMAVARCIMSFRGSMFSGIFCNHVRHFADSPAKPPVAEPLKDNKVGFIGLGKMGTHMARNLMNKGYKLIMFDIFPDNMTELENEGAVVAKHPAELAEQVNRIVSVLPSTASVIEVYDGSHGILRKVQKGTLMIDSSTIDPSQSQEISELAQELGASYVDAPVSGGVIAAKAATLTFMVGGDDNDFESAQELLKCMGSNIVHCGEVGTGQAVKICNNMLLGISMLGTAETMNLGIRLGLDPKLLAKILNSSSGRCWSSEVYNPVPGVLEDVPASKDYQPGFSTTLMTKDLSLAQSAALSTISPTPLGATALQFFRLMMLRGFSDKDFSSVFLFLQEMKDGLKPK